MGSATVGGLTMKSLTLRVSAPIAMWMDVPPVKPVTSTNAINAWTRKQKWRKDSVCVHRN